MRHIVRIVIIAIALVALYLSPVVAASSSGTTTYVWSGIAVDLVAIVAVIAAIATWRKRPAAS